MKMIRGKKLEGGVGASDLPWLRHNNFLRWMREQENVSSVSYAHTWGDSWAAWFFTEKWRTCAYPKERLTRVQMRTPLIFICMSNTGKRGQPRRGTWDRMGFVDIWTEREKSRWRISWPNSPLNEATSSSLKWTHTNALFLFKIRSEFASRIAILTVSRDRQHSGMLQHESEIVCNRALRSERGKRKQIESVGFTAQCC